MRLCPWSLALASSVPVLGLKRFCPRKGCPWPWPRIFFVSLALASSLVSSTPPLINGSILEAESTTFQTFENEGHPSAHIMQIQYFCQKIQSIIFFSKGKQLQNLLRLFFFEQVKSPRASKHLILLARRASCRKS